jgi:phosphonopyruvate decarboxylase
MMDAGHAVAAIREARADEVVVTTMSGLGFWPEAGPLDFRLLGLMGAAGSIGLGIALAQPEKDVWVIDGDGSLLMQLGVLAAVGDAEPARFTHIVLDNRVYAISGAQAVPASRTLSWCEMAAAAGYASAVECHSADELKVVLGDSGGGPRLISVRCVTERPHYLAGAFAIDAGGEAARLRATLAREPSLGPRRPASSSPR